MRSLIIPENYNYIAVFLTFACNLKCSFCINNFESSPRKKQKRKYLSGEEWAVGLNRIISRPDLPVSLQGGEPTLHKDFPYIVNNIRRNLNIDVLTNLRDERVFLDNINPGRIKRKAPYASIRVSYHPEQMKLEPLIKRVLRMLDAGFSIGIWAVDYPAPETQKEIVLAKKICKETGIDFRLKEYLGEYNGNLYGHYLYKGACDKRFKKAVRCKTTELIIGPDGNIYRCTADIYESRSPIGHILDPDFEIKDKFKKCSWFGHCNPCDIKMKTNRFQEFGHTSVFITGDVEKLSPMEIKKAAECCAAFNKANA